MRVTPQVALVYTPLVLLFHNNQGKVALLNTIQQHNTTQQPRQVRIADFREPQMLLLLAAVVDFCQAHSWYSVEHE